MKCIVISKLIARMHQFILLGKKKAIKSNLGDGKSQKSLEPLRIICIS